MSTTTSPHVMYRLDAEVLTRLGLPDMVFPVRSEKVEEIFDGATVAFGLVVDELDQYVAAHPETVEVYRSIIARLTHLAGTNEGTEGRPEAAARYFARGLSYAPDSFRLNADLALAYQTQGRLNEAAAQYRRALALEPDNPLILLLAARANQALGYNDVALEMLQACPADYLNDSTFMDLYRSLGGEAPTPSDTNDRTPGMTIDQTEHPQRSCTRCGTALEPSHRFCPTCGHNEEPTPESPTPTSAAEWVYVLDPVEVRGLHDTEVVVGNLQPETWYLLVSEEGAWVRVADPDGRLEGWAPAAQIHRRSDVVERTLDPEPMPVPVEAEPAWSVSHTVPGEGIQAWAAPEPAGPVITTLAGGVELQVTERRADWAHVRAQNDWEAWVDGRRLVAAGTSAPTSAGAPASSTSKAQATSRLDPTVWTGGGLNLKALTDGSSTKRIQLAAAGAMLVSAFLSWAGGGGNAFDIPIAFLWKLDVEPSGFSLGIVLLVLAVATAVVVLVGNRRHQMIAGGVAVGVTAVFLLQFMRILTNFSESFFSAVGTLFTDGFGIAPWLLLAAGVALLVKR